MIAEIVKFTERVPARLMSLNAKPKPGLHILFRLSLEGQQWTLQKPSLPPLETQQQEEEGKIAEVADIAYYDGKAEPTAFLEDCCRRAGAAWCINTNKCFDLPAKGIHSCSPYCVAFKRESLRGGAKYANDKEKIEARFSAYFGNAFNLVAEETRPKLELFADFFQDATGFYAYLERVPGFKKLKDKDYIIFYLDEPVEVYAVANERYLQDKLFNTNEYNAQREDGEMMGTSDFLNGFNSKKPFLQHQSATFQIPGRISAFEARKLNEFSELMRQGVFPRPLPIFVNQAEAEALQQKYYRTVQLEIDQEKTPSHRSVIEALFKETSEGLGNFYLLYFARGEVKDFDFVPKFYYELRDADGKAWSVSDLFNIGYAPTISNVFELQDEVLPVIFDNSLVVKKKDAPIRLKYFDDIEEKYCKSSGIYLLVMRFRAAFYDFIYKSRRQAVTTAIFHEVMRAGLLENIRLDQVKDGNHSEGYKIKQKLNIWLSFYHHFEHNHQKSYNMENQIKALRRFMDELASGQRDIATDEEGAFAVGQVIAYLFRQISSGKQSHSQLEPFLRKKSDDRFKEDLVKLFDRYKHVNHTKRFSAAFSQVLACHWEKPIASYLPIMLSGYFSDNELLKAKKPKGDAEEEE
jgi:CRISPR-associated protein Csh1